MGFVSTQGIHSLFYRVRDVAAWESIRLWCDWSSDQSHIVLHKAILSVVSIKNPLLFIKKSSPCSDGSRFPFLLSEWFYYIFDDITVNKMC